ncbi:MAG: hypothetical protein GY951_07165 [Psychromonas sp.]|nr:hypothetical protein [Alteromonadales bacterium]MCP5077823.1 hypothetical protein [Psychromonas sp.]
MFKYSKIAIAIALSGSLFACGGGGSSSSSGSGSPSSGGDAVSVALKITSHPELQATEDITYSYQVMTTKSAEQIAAFSLVSASDAISLSSTGLLTWTPSEGVDTSGELSITASFDNGDSDTQSFTLSVTAVNDEPVLSAVANQSVESGDTLSFQLVVTDPDDTSFTYERVAGPEGLTIDSSGVVTFTSSATTSADQTVTLKVADGGEDNAQPSSVSFVLSELYYKSLAGNLKNYYTNEAINNGSIKLAINGEVVDTAVTAEDGTFTLRYLDTLNFSNAIISSNTAGYAEASKRVATSEVEQVNNLFLPPVHAQVSFNANEASELAVDGKILVSIEKDSFVDSNGVPVTGEITSELFIIDPSLDLDLMPGEMITADPENGSAVAPIESFGAITATFTDADGKRLQLGNGHTAEVRIPASGTNPPETIPLYYYDNVNGIWVEEGSAKLTTVDGEQYYIGNVSHFTTWNADRIYETVMLAGCVVDTGGERIVDARVNTEGLDYNGRSSGFSDSEGNFSLAARMNSTVFVSASNGQQSRTITIDTLSEGFNIDDCLVLDNATSKIELKWGQTPSDLDSHFYGPDDNGERFHISFLNEFEVVNGSSIYLDVDDISSYGPEVITVPEYSLPGTYQYAVYNYSEVDGVIERTEARVELIINNERVLFIPPEGEAKLWWHVFEVEVAEDGSTTVNIINEWADSEPVQNVVSDRARHSSGENKQSIASTKLKNKYYSK